MGRTVRSEAVGGGAVGDQQGRRSVTDAPFELYFPHHRWVDGGSGRGAGTGRRGIDAHLQLLRGELREVNALLLRHDTRCRPNPCGI